MEQIMIGPLNLAAAYRDPVDRTPMYDVDSPPPSLIDKLDRYAYELGYPTLCATFEQQKRATPERPKNMANAPVLHAWIAVLSVEASLLEFARQHEIRENEAYRFFVRMRGRGIPKSPAWQLALKQAREGITA